jgi:hypothetical protein
MKTHILSHSSLANFHPYQPFSNHFNLPISCAPKFIKFYFKVFKIILNFNAIGMWSPSLFKWLVIFHLDDGWLCWGSSKYMMFWRMGAITHHKYILGTMNVSSLKHTHKWDSHYPFFLSKRQNPFLSVCVCDWTCLKKFRINFGVFLVQ